MENDTFNENLWEHIPDLALHNKIWLIRFYTHLQTTFDDANWWICDGFAGWVRPLGKDEDIRPLLGDLEQFLAEDMEWKGARALSGINLAKTYKEVLEQVHAGTIKKHVWSVVQDVYDKPEYGLLFEEEKTALQVCELFRNTHHKTGDLFRLDIKRGKIVRTMYWNGKKYIRDPYADGSF